MKKDTQATQDVGNSKYFTLMETLLNLGAEINLQNVFGETPLMQASFHNNEEAVRFLLEHKAKWKLKNKYSF
jgi:ankyrin repeat protein